MLVNFKEMSNFSEWSNKQLVEQLEMFCAVKETLQNYDAFSFILYDELSCMMAALRSECASRFILSVKKEGGNK